MDVNLVQIVTGQNVVKGDFMVQLEETKIKWPDTGVIEEGFILDTKEKEILFRSYDDKTINWIPKKFIITK